MPGLVELFSILSKNENFSVCQPELNTGTYIPNPDDIALVYGMYSSANIDFSCFPQIVYRFFELSVNAFKAFVSAWMSELPLQNEMLRFGRKILACKTRYEADCVSNNRTDNDARLIHEAAYKVWHEINRFSGLLRFSPDNKGVYIARCEPDHFILPALTEHFFLRFRSIPWKIIDEKRFLCLCCTPEGLPIIEAVNPQTENNNSTKKDPWENLWLTYHSTINNESRNNPNLQKQFVPKRYWKNLPEFKGK